MYLRGLQDKNVHKETARYQKVNTEDTGYQERFGHTIETPEDNFR